jgi:hypothetical protein
MNKHSEIEELVNKAQTDDREKLATGTVVN